MSVEIDYPEVHQSSAQECVHVDADLIVVREPVVEGFVAEDLGRVGEAPSAFVCAKKRVGSAVRSLGAEDQGLQATEAPDGLESSPLSRPRSSSESSISAFQRSRYPPPSRKRWMRPAWYRSGRSLYIPFGYRIRLGPSGGPGIGDADQHDQRIVNATHLAD